MQRKTTRTQSKNTNNFKFETRPKKPKYQNSKDSKTDSSSKNIINLNEEENIENKSNRTILSKKPVGASNLFQGVKNSSAKSKKVGLKASKLFYKINNNFLSSKISNFSDTRYLNVFAFNVGQANFILLKCGDEVVIVDAGAPSKSKALGKNNNPIPNELEINIFPQVDKVLKNTKIKAVFITHPHTDHYNLIEYLFNKYWKVQKELCRLFLGGTKQDWTTVLSSFEFKDKPKTEIQYVTSYNKTPKNIISDIFSNPDIVFTFILPEEFTGNTPNGLSFLMKVKYQNNKCNNNNCSFLFTGDAEGNNLQETIGSANQKKILTALFNELPNQGSKYIKTTPKNAKKPSTFSATANRSLFNNIGCVFVPHHGSRSEDSGRFISYLEDQPIPPATFIISSEVSSCQHNLPKRGAWESVSRRPIEHPAHFFTYHNGTSKKIKLTKKRVYITEAAPGGVYWLISDGKTIWMYNAYREDPNDENSDLGFFPITTVSDKIKDDWAKINPKYKDCISDLKQLDNLKGGDDITPGMCGLK